MAGSGGGGRAWLAAVTVDGQDVPGAQLLDQFAVLFDDDMVDPAFSEQGGNSLADPAVAHQHDLAGELRLVGTHRQFGQRIRAVLESAREGRVGAQPRLKGSNGGENQRVAGDRDERAG